MTTHLPADLRPYADVITSDDPRFPMLPTGFSLSDAAEREIHEGLLQAAVDVARHVLTSTLEDAMGYFSTIGPFAAAAAAMTTAERDALFERLRGWLAPRVTDGLLAMSAAAWIVTAMRD